MTARKRDYRAEYARRIERALRKGLSRSQARGHARPTELPIRQGTAPSAYSRQLETGLREIKGGRSLTAAARDIHVAPERLRRYIVNSGIAEKRGQRWAIGPDTRRRVMPLYSDGEAIDITVSLPEAEEIGRYMASVRQFLDSNNIAFLMPFEGQYATDINGRSYPFETDPNELYRLAETGGSTFEDVYRIVV